MKNILTISLLTIATITWASNGTDVGGGGIGAEINGTFTLRDLAKQCEWKKGKDVKKMIPGIENLYSEIGRQNYVLEAQLNSIANVHVYCFTDKTLKIPASANRKYIIDYVYKNKVIGIYNHKNIVYVNKQNFNALSNYQKGLFFIHESSHPFMNKGFVKDSHQEDLENYIEYLDMNFQLKVDQKQFNEYLEKSKVLTIYNDAIYKHGIKKDVLSLLAGDKKLRGLLKLDESYYIGDPLSVYHYLKGVQKGSGTLNPNYVLRYDYSPLAEIARAEFPKLQEMIRSAILHNSNDDKGIKSILDKGVSPNHHLKLVSPNHHLKLYEKNMYKDFKEEEMKLVISIGQFARFYDKKKSYKAIENDSRYKKDNKVYDYGSVKSSNLVTYFLDADRVLEVENDFELDYENFNKFSYKTWSINHFDHLVSNLLVNSTNEFDLPGVRKDQWDTDGCGYGNDMFCEKFDDRRIIRAGYFELFFSEFYKNLSRFKDKKSTLLNYKEFLKSKEHKFIKEYREKMLRILANKNINFFAQSRVSDFFELLNRSRTKISVFFKNSNKRREDIEYWLWFVMPIWEAVLTNEMRIKRQGDDHHGPYTLGNGHLIGALVRFVTIINEEYKDWRKNPRRRNMDYPIFYPSMCKMFQKLTTDKWMMGIYKKKYLDQVINKYKLPNFKFCRYDDLLKAIPYYVE